MAKRKEPVLLLPTVQLGDREYLKVVTRKLLARLEKEVENKDPFLDLDGDWHQRAHERIFGPKTSLAHTLVTLSDLLLRLSGQEEVAVAPAPLPLTAGDIALVEAFVARTQEHAPA